MSMVFITQSQSISSCTPSGVLVMNVSITGGHCFTVHPVIGVILIAAGAGTQFRDSQL